nr:putative ribonuclease H-like domain-containing protein [Tanacetum cinerariifolium]
EELLQFKMQKVWVLVDLPHEKRAIGTKWVFRNKKDERGIVDPNYLDKVYKVVKALYGLHQPPRAWYETLANYLLENGFQRVKRIFRYLMGKPHLGLWYPKDSLFDLVAYLDSDYTGASLDRKSTTRGCQFLRCRLISWQCRKQTIVATSSTEAEYVAAASCYAQYGVFEKDGACYKYLNPDQTVSGKDSSNPLMADNLPKFLWYSTHHVALMKSWLVQKQTALGVNTPRSNEDRLELMELMVFLLPSDEKVRVEVNDVTRLQALVDKKKVVVTEATIRDALRLDDAEGVECLPNEEIFTELVRMSYEKPSTKLTFYKAFLSSQWKFLIHTIL